MKNRIKKVLNISLVKSYKNKKGNYEISGDYLKFIEYSRFLKSIKEISNLKVNKTTEINFYKIKLNPIHLNLLARGIKNQNKSTIKIKISSCEFSSKTILQLRYLITNLPQLSAIINFKITSLEEWLCVLHILSSLSSWESEYVFFDLYFSQSSKFRFEAKIFHQKLLNIYVKNSIKIKGLYFYRTRISNYEYFRSISDLKPFKQYGKGKKLKGNGSIFISHSFF